MTCVRLTVWHEKGNCLDNLLRFFWGLLMWKAKALALCVASCLLVCRESHGKVPEWDIRMVMNEEVCVDCCGRWDLVSRGDCQVFALAVQCSKLYVTIGSYSLRENWTNVTIQKTTELPQTHLPVCYLKFLFCFSSILQIICQLSVRS